MTSGDCFVAYRVGATSSSQSGVLTHCRRSARAQHRVAKLQSKTTNDVCTATASLLTGLGGDGSLPSETVSVLIFEMGQLQTLAHST